MDRKSILILVVCFALMMLWPAMVNRMFPPPPASARTNLVASATGTNAAVGAAGTNRAATTNGIVAPPSITLPASPVAAWIPPTGPEQTLTLETPESVYTFTSHGGGVKSVALKHHPEAVACGRAKAKAGNELATLNDNAPVPALALFGGATFDDGTPFTLRQSPGAVIAEKRLTNGLRLAKEFRLGTNYLLHVTLRIDNPGPAAVSVPPQELVIGTATPLGPYDNGQYVQAEWYDGAAKVAVNQGWFANRSMGGCVPGTPRSEYLSPGASNVVWASVQNQYFAMVVIPQQTAYQLAARPVDLPKPTPEQRAADTRLIAKPVGYQAALVYPALNLPPGQTVEWQFDVFSGPKEFNTLAKLGRDVDLIMGFNGFFGWFARLLLLSMNGLHALGLSYGLTIIAITAIIKILFWPLTQASTRSMKRMQALQPKMKEIQEKYKADPKKMNQKLMEFMKENKVSPLGGCLPMLLQIPVFFGFFQMLRSAIELRGASFLWACDLSQPDTVALVFGVPINPLPLIMGASQFWQAKLTPPSPGVDPVQQKMMQYMPLLFVFMLYNFSAGLALYWTVQNLLSILQMKLTKANAGGPPAPVAAPAARR